MTMMARTKALPMIAYIAIADLIAAATSPTAAQEVQAQSGVAIDGKTACVQMKTGGATRPSEGFTPPRKVAGGETFSSAGKTRQIGIIGAAQVKGEWLGVVVEASEDIRVDTSRDRTWLSLLKCQPDLAGNAPLPRPE